MNRAGRQEDMADADAVLQHVVVVLVPADRRAAGASPHHGSNEACGCSQCMCGTSLAGPPGSELIAMAAGDETDPKSGAQRAGVEIPASGAPAQATHEPSTEAAKPRPPVSSRIPSVIVGLVAAAVVGLSIWYLVRPQPLLVQGEVDATRLDIAARVDGRVAEIPVVRGQNVPVGAVLVRIDNPETLAKHEQA